MQVGHGKNKDNKRRRKGIQQKPPLNPPPHEPPKRKQPKRKPTKRKTPGQESAQSDEPQPGRSSDQPQPEQPSEQPQPERQDQSSDEEDDPPINPPSAYDKMRKSLENNGFFNVTEFMYREYPRWSQFGVQTRIHMAEPPEGIDMISWLERIVREIHSIFTSIVEAEDKFGFEILTPNTGYPLAMPYRTKDEFNVQDVWDLFFSMAQSWKGFEVDEPIDIKVDYVKLPRGKGRVDIKEFARKRSILTIRNDDNLCLPRSIVAGIANYKKRNLEPVKGEYFKEWEQVRKTYRGEQERRAIDLLNNAGCTIPATGAGVEELGIIQEHLAHEGIAILVYKLKGFGKGVKPFYDGREIVERRLSVHGVFLAWMCEMFI